MARELVKIGRQDQIHIHTGKIRKAQIQQAQFTTFALAERIQQAQSTTFALAERIQRSLREIFGQDGNGNPLSYPVVSNAFVVGGFSVIELDPLSIRTKAQAHRVMDPMMLAAYSKDVDRPVWGTLKFPRKHATLQNGAWLVTSWLEPEDAAQTRMQKLPVQADTSAQSIPEIEFGVDLDSLPQGKFMFPIGRRDDGVDWFASMVDIIHLMVIGETGAGKSNLFKGILYSLTQRNSPDQLRVALCSAKGSQFSMFAGLPHLWRSDEWAGFVATEAVGMSNLIMALVEEFKRRDAEFGRYRVDNLKDYTRKSGKTYPRILFMADELLTIALLVKSSERDTLMNQLAALLNLGRSHGFHLFLAITKPNYQTVPTAITHNIDNRISYRVADAVTSDRFDCPGAHLIPKDARGQFVARIDGKLYRGRSFMVTDANDPESEEPPAAPAPPATVKNSVEITTRIAPLVLYAVDNLNRLFVTNALYQVFRGQWRSLDIKDLARKLEECDEHWLVPEREGKGRRSSRIITAALEERARVVMHEMARQVLDSAVVQV